MNSISFDDLDGLKIELEYISGNSGSIRICFDDDRPDVVVPCRLKPGFEEYRRATHVLTKEEAEDEIDLDRKNGIFDTKMGSYKRGYAIYYYRGKNTVVDNIHNKQNKG
jgi:hypothetical protein